MKTEMLMTVEPHRYNDFAQKYAAQQFGAQRFGQAFCNHFELYKSTSLRLLHDMLWEADFAEAQRLIRKHVNFS